MRIWVVIFLSVVARADVYSPQFAPFVPPSPIQTPQQQQPDQDRKDKANEAAQQAAQQAAQAAQKAMLYKMLSDQAEARGDAASAQMFKTMMAMELAQGIASAAAAGANKRASKAAQSTPAPINMPNFQTSPSPQASPSETPDDEFDRLGQMMTTPDPVASPTPGATIVEAVVSQSPQPTSTTKPAGVRTANEALTPIPDQNLTFNEKSKAIDGGADGSGGFGRGFGVTSGSGNGPQAQNGEVNVADKSLEELHPGLRARANLNGVDPADVVGGGGSDTKAASAPNSFESLMSQFLGGGNSVESQWAAMKANNEILLVKANDPKKQSTLFDLAKTRFERAFYEEGRIGLKSRTIPTRQTASVSSP